MEDLGGAPIINSSSSSSCSSSPADYTASSDELGEIIELPSLEGSYDDSSAAELAVVDSVEGWLHPPWWASDKDFCEYFIAGGGETQTTTALVPCSFY
ncbi:hypothetical protein ACJIZ3_025459 [Penstemon smallii]|uniref:Uncharacterized protein n=1 Tax=Penstemon smallii TaxID=265156 RepID=A0ABD3TX72_9LAMI